MKLTYNLTQRPTMTTCALKSCDIRDALFYFYKEDDAVSFEISVINPKLDLSSSIYKTENLKTMFKVWTNTSDILVTDIVINNVPYYYEIKTINNTLITPSDIVLNTNIDVIEYNGRLYSNTYINNYEIKDGTFIYSVPTVNSNVHTIKYNSDSILITIPKTKEQTMVAKPASNLAITSNKINDNFVNLSSFYVKTRSKTFQYIEGDVLYFNKRELSRVQGNYLHLKDKVKDTTFDGYLSRANNTIYLTDYYVNATDILIEYVAKKSSHIFEVEDSLAIKLQDNSLVLTTEEDCDFLIKKKINTAKFYLKSNDFLDTNKFVLKPKSIGLLFNTNLNEFKKKMLTNYLAKDHYLNPSREVYLYINDTKIFQEQTTADIVVNKITKESIYNYLEDDYTVPTLNIIDLDKDKTHIVPIAKNLYKEV